MEMSMTIDQEKWHGYLERFVRALGSLPEAAPLLKAVAPLVFQYKITDRPEMNYWQLMEAGTIRWGPGEYQGNPLPTVIHTTDFETIKKVNAGESDPIQETMSGRYAVEGDVSKLMACAPLIPINPKAHAIAVGGGRALSE
jgi:hypothetical protein